jgi:hypothetical protein
MVPRVPRMAHQILSGATFSAWAVALLSSCSSCAPSLNVFVLILTEVTLSYVCSRIYLYHPPDATDAFMPHPEIPAEALRKEQELAEVDPDVNPWACIIVLAITVGLMDVTAEFVRFTRLSHSRATLSRLSPQLVDSVTFVQSESQINEEYVHSRPAFISLQACSRSTYHIIGGSASSSSQSCPSLPTAPPPSCTFSVPSCDASSRRRSLQIFSLRRARST